MRNRPFTLFCLAMIWGVTFIYMYLIYSTTSTFTPTIAAAMSGIAFLISPYSEVKSFLMNLRFGRAFFSILFLALFTLFAGAQSPNYASIPVLFGIFLITSAIVDRLDKKK